MNISVLILTYNEEVNLPRCIESVGWCDDVVILDSSSTDATIDIAETAGARVFQRPFDDYASQRNHGLNKIDYKHSWVLMLDADEQIDPELTSEIKDKLSEEPSDTCLYRIRRKDFFFGHWIKRSSGYPTWFGRLIKVGYVKIERAINEEYHTDGKVRFLDGHLLHNPFNKGMASWFEKHNRYSTMEADLIANSAAYNPKISEIFSKDPANRRKAVKSIAYRLPFRPFIVFAALYLFRGGFLDGRHGLMFCLLRSFYEFMINCKTKELQFRRKNLQV